MAMAVSEQGFLIQGENSRDFPELEEPYEEINVLDLENAPGRHYGWPYCYNWKATSPEWIEDKDRTEVPTIRTKFRNPVDCTGTAPTSENYYTPPWSLMPPHVAPLHMAYYNGSMFQDFFGKNLLVSWHGYQPTGHRLVAYAVDAQGRPQRPPLNRPEYAVDVKGACPTHRAFQPHGGMDAHAPYQEIISGWSAINGVRPKGAPVGFTAARDGSIWIVEDRENRTIVRLASIAPEKSYRDQCQSGGSDEVPSPGIDLLVARNLHLQEQDLMNDYGAVRSKFIGRYCTGCHGNLQAHEVMDDEFMELDFLLQNDWLVTGNKEKSKIFGAISHAENYTPMPPIDKEQPLQSSEGIELIRRVGQWIDQMPTNLLERARKQTMDTNRNIRQSPSTGATICGKFLEDDHFYVDSSAQDEIRQNGWLWQRVFILPRHRRLFDGQCEYPKDGVFYVATKKL